jgi:hypothetical protein
MRVKNCKLEDFYRFFCRFVRVLLSGLQKVLNLTKTQYRCVINLFLKRMKITNGRYAIK